MPVQKRRPTDPGISDGAEQPLTDEQKRRLVHAWMTADQGHPGRKPLEADCDNYGPFVILSGGLNARSSFTASSMS
jgi:hypothetical protein